MVFMRPFVIACNHGTNSDLAYFCMSVENRPYRIAGFCREDFNVVSHGIRNIKIRDIFYLVTFIT